MRSILSSALVLVLAASATAAPRTKFPYSTTVLSDDVEVRSGPGSKYYTTSKLRRGQRVVVHRHDPGGWQMIAPPEGSYSWVKADEVRKTSADAGVVIVPQLDVRVGGRDSRQRDVFQSSLAEGDEVRILGEQRLPGDAGEPPAKWFRIVPPRGEWRWVAAQSLAPAPQQGKSRSIIPAGGFADDEEAPVTPGTEVNTPDSPGFAGGPTGAEPSAPLRTTPTFADEEPAHAPAGEPTGAAPSSPTAPSERPYLDHDTLRGVPKRPQVTKRRSSAGPTRDDMFDRHLAEMEQIDERLRAVVATEPLTWNLDPIEQDYRVLQGQVVSEALSEMIDVRLGKLGAFHRLQAQRFELRQIMLDTERRDAQIVAARQAGIPPDSIITPSNAPRAPEFAQIPGGPIPGRGVAPAPQSAGAPSFDGAGIVQRANVRRGTPPYALVAPNGQLLAYLAPTPGVDLNTWQQREAGVIGRRVYDPRLRADVITVTGMNPVRLAR